MIDDNKGGNEAKRKELYKININTCVAHRILKLVMTTMSMTVATMNS